MDEDEMPPKSPQLDAQRSAIVDFDKNWTSLQGALRSVSNLEPVLIDCAQNENSVESEAIANLEGKYFLFVLYKYVFLYNARYCRLQSYIRIWLHIKCIHQV